ncbi:MAG: phage tail assembly protein [Oscillospiraceae bacterium]|nr:phage tail assembly protein [Oscillospiraceae bacterium]
MRDTENNTEEPGTHINPEEFEAVQRDAADSKDTYTHKFKKPFIYDGQEYTELRFDWDGLSGADALAIEREVEKITGVVVIAEEFSSEYLIRMAAKCCTQEIGPDAFELMRQKDYKRIKSRAKSFLLASE